jgi:hypothetical protein
LTEWLRELENKFIPWGITFAKRRVASRTNNFSSAQGSKSRVTQPAFDDDQLKILVYLKEAGLALQNHYKIESATRVSRKTIGIKIRALIEKGLVDYKQNKGGVLTSSGVELVNGLNPRIYSKLTRTFRAD